ncbi:MAG: FtsL-like putative cell division protein [Flavobacteriaceae bacterium]|nr:FtsL-like putative cell division protein [Flavobacteriaceae bacterium]
MIKKIVSFLKMEFLIKEDSFKNWRMILFFSILALIMISSGHSADNKVFKIANLNEQIKALKSEFIEQRTYLMKLKMESNIVNVLSDKGIFSSKTPQTKIIVTK